MSTAQAEYHAAQARLNKANGERRNLQITLYLTGAKEEQIKKSDNPPKDSPAQMINALLSTVDPDTGEPYIHLKAGRPKWDAEFTAVADLEAEARASAGVPAGGAVGVVFCGAPAIAAALKEACEKNSSREGTIFRLHKENF